MAYATITEADALLALQPTWVASTDLVAKQNHLDIATTYLDALYGSRYPGTVVSSTQSELWPRTAIVDAFGLALSGIPDGIKKATAEAAYLSFSGKKLLPSTVSSGGTTSSSTNAGLTQKTVKVGSIDITSKFATGGTTSGTETAVQLADERGIPLISYIAGLMEPYIGGATSTSGSNFLFLRA